MKVILISIKPQRLVNILNGDSTIEPRTSKVLAKAAKKLIQEYGYAQFFAYCGKGKPYLNERIEYDYDSMNYYEPHYDLDLDNKTYLNGKVVCSFKCYELEEIKMDFAPRDSFFDECCMTPIELFDYIGHSKWCAIHISDLNTFDKPKELSEFQKWNEPIRYPYVLIEAPRDFCYIEIPDDKQKEN